MQADTMMYCVLKGRSIKPKADGQASMLVNYICHHHLTTSSKHPQRRIKTKQTHKSLRSHLLLAHRYFFGQQKLILWGHCRPPNWLERARLQHKLINWHAKSTINEVGSGIRHLVGQQAMFVEVVMFVELHHFGAIDGRKRQGGLGKRQFKQVVVYVG
jgi:hypothetical protein